MCIILVVVFREYVYNFFYIFIYGLIMFVFNVYVIDDLKSWMVKVDVNWFDICWKVIEIEFLCWENKGLGFFDIEDVKEWIIEELDFLSEYGSVVVKFYLYIKGKVVNEVKILL